MEITLEYNEAIAFFMNIVKNSFDFIIPIYMYNKSKRYPEFVGSSVYCTLGSKRLLLSADHVFKRIYPEKILYPFSKTHVTEIIEIPCDGIHWHKESELDIGIIELEKELLGWEPLLSEYFTSFNDNKKYQHLLIGYPGSSTKKSDRTTQRIELKGYLTNAASKEKYSRLKVNKNDKLLVEFKKENVLDDKGRRLTFPDPNGMSGGAVFQFYEDQPDNMNLVGIMNEWDINKKDVVIATRIEKYLELFDFKRINLTIA